jgi:hypothetical protein
LLADESIPNVEKTMLIGAHIQFILVVTGLLTAGAVIVVLAPAAVLTRAFGKTPLDEASLAIARHWGLLMFLIGALLVYAAFDPPIREPVILAGAIEKAVLGAGVLGTGLREHPAARAAAIRDSLMALILFLYLAGF